MIACQSPQQPDSRHADSLTADQQSDSLTVSSLKTHYLETEQSTTANGKPADNEYNGDTAADSGYHAVWQSGHLSVIVSPFGYLPVAFFIKLCRL